MDGLLFWVIPPAAGARIGFATTVIAIKMLFRPLREVRIFGFRLPFTPGVLPKERHKLALSIGAMTEKHLLTEELIKERFSDAEFGEKILGQVAEATGAFLSLELEKNPWFPGADRGAPSGFSRFLSRLVVSFLDSPLFDGAAGALGRALLSGGEDRTLSGVLGAENSKVLEEKIRGFITGALQGGSGSAALENLIGAQYPLLVRSLISLLKRDDVHRELEAQGRIFLSGAILKLNVLQRFFISAAQYDRTLNERMGEIVDDFIGQLEASLEDRVIRDRVTGLLLKSAAGFFENHGAEGFLRLLSSGLLNTRVKELAAFFGGSPGPGSALGSWLRGLVKDEAALSRNLDDFFRPLGGKSPAELAGLDPEKKAALDRRITAILLRGARERAGAVLASLDIKAMVAAKIDSLDMEEVEAMVLGIMADKLKWIDLFGAILGGLIGLSQTLLNLFRV
jgi:hypothetical protein